MWKPLEPDPTGALTPIGDTAYGSVANEGSLP
jgi:hypothetical protein